MPDHHTIALRRWISKATNLMNAAANCRALLRTPLFGSLGLLLFGVPLRVVNTIKKLREGLFSVTKNVT
jgi:hypothetical protein